MAFTANDLAQVRFAISPMWEVAPSFRLLMANTRHPVHLPWAEQVRPRVLAAGLDRGWLAELIGPSGYVPDFLTPAPAGPAPAPADEWDAILASPAEQVRQDLDHLARHQGHLGTRLSGLRADPVSRLAKVAREIETYWELALAPYWARIRAVLEADIFHRARTVAEHGTGRLFNDLHATVSWNDNVLGLVRRKRDMPRESSGAGLLLIPSAFTGPGVRTQVRPPDPPQIAYPARTVGALWEKRPATGVAALTGVLGRSRTLLLTELETPASTTELAHRTGLSPAGVSQYLTALRNAGMVSAHRAGRFVLYARTAAAETVLAAASA
ncbi:helix-turn-helix domain-containing protein [Streptomyces cinnabarinus]|uniref:Helix-turn-helix domain-containing protein n=1 Tax=Streptomyces cinnabarinus TaxID=67287 RepID=A0ABY7KRT5_9ACTN|nr:helix-turn-helix domain-containing protein [Streptomyces cinnabarinus]WAZ27330.1 helix-turn-helix domain-containing protein [Streptomyces cinnabarinus]